MHNCSGIASNNSAIGLDSMATITIGEAKVEVGTSAYTVVIMKSPNGDRWLVTIGYGGVMNISKAL